MEAISRLDIGWPGYERTWVGCLIGLSFSSMMIYGWYFDLGIVTLGCSETEDFESFVEESKMHRNFSLKIFFCSCRNFYISFVGLICLGFSVNKLHDFIASYTGF